MKRKFWLNNTVSSCLIVGSLCLTACNNDSKNDQVISHDKTIKPIDSTIVVSSIDYDAPQLKQFTSLSKLVTYKMPGVNNKDVETQTIVMVPNGTPPKDGWPIIVWAHGTTGVADKCAPSKTQDVGGEVALISTLLKEGYMVVAPDYEGLGSEGIHPHLNLKSQAQSLTYGLKAAKELIKNSSDRWMAVGHSQGGQSVLGVEQFNSGTNYDLKGIVAVAPGSHFVEIAPSLKKRAFDILSKENLTEQDQQAAIFSIALMNVSAAYATAGLRSINPAFEYSEVFEERSIDIAKKAEEECSYDHAALFATDMVKYLATGQNILTYPGLKADFDKNPKIIEYLNAAEPGNEKIISPVLIIQGALDFQVAQVATDKLVEKMKGLGSNVTYIVKPEDGHVSAFKANTADIMEFVKKNMPAK